jgi:RecB family exonuclease
VDAPIRTRPLSPSKLSLAFGCKLRYLFETEPNDLVTVPGSVSLFLGRAVHNAIHAVFNGEISHSHDAIRQYVISRLVAYAQEATTIRSILNAIDLQLSEKVIVTPARLADAVRTAFEVSGRKNEITAMETASDIDDHHQVKDGSAGSKGADAARVFGSEVRLSSSRFDLAGQADSIERLASATIRITDYKTGSANDGTGQLRQEYRLQVGSYALIVRDLFSDQTIMQKIVAADCIWEEKFTPKMSDEIAELVQTLSTAILFGVRTSCRELAAPGKSCSRCRFRPSCPEYKLWAPDQWSKSRGETPLDSWGVTESLERRSDQLVDVRMIDEAGRHVRIMALPDSMFIKKPNVGDRLELYELNSFETGGQGRYPRNFYVTNPVHPYTSAFSAIARTPMSRTSTNTPGV